MILCHFYIYAGKLLYLNDVYLSMFNLELGKVFISVSIPVYKLTSLKVMETMFLEIIQINPKMYSFFGKHMTFVNVFYKNKHFATTHRNVKYKINI